MNLEQQTIATVAAITVIQPFAALLCLPAGDPRKKRVENRTWCAPRSLIGKPLAIHAGKAKRYRGESVVELARDYDLDPERIVFGAMTGIGILQACLSIDEIYKGTTTYPHHSLPTELRWLCKHRHTEGPWCWVLPDVVPIEPVYCNGSQRLWSWTVPSRKDGE